MSNIKEVNRLHPDARREQILLVAAAHFARDDQDTVSIQAIAVDAGVTRSLVYHYFPGNDALLNAVLQREAEKLLAATAPVEGLTPRENLEHALGAWLDHVSASTGRLRDLLNPHSSTAMLVADLVARNHTVQVQRVLDHLGLNDTAATRLAISAWLAFVVEAARQQTSAQPAVSRAEIIRLCLHALCAVTGENMNSVLNRLTPQQQIQKDKHK